MFYMKYWDTSLSAVRMVPICLPIIQRNRTFDGKTLEAFGWGATDVFNLGKKFIYFFYFIVDKRLY